VKSARVEELILETDESQFEIHPQHRSCPSELYIRLSMKNSDTAKCVHAGHQGI
jgi:hypothetical protein